MAERDDLILVIAEALDCFWNAAIGAAHARGDFDAMSTATVVSQGVAAVSARLREIAAEREVAASDRIERLERALLETRQPARECYGCVNPNNACARCKPRLARLENTHDPR
jgi:hypothetical protein